MASARTRDPLSADATERLVEFARACKAAIRIVAMYPASHPNIAAALSRMTGAGLGATANGPMLLTVGPDALLMDGRALAKPDPTVTELALLLREHHIGELTLNGPLTADGWHMLLSLLARSPEDVRLAGGIARAWHSAGGGAVEIREIDYGEVLRERTGSADGSWESLIASCLVGDAQTTRDKSTRAPLLHVAADAGRLEAFIKQLQERAREAGQGADDQRQTVVGLVQTLAVCAAEHAPGDFDAIMTNVATVATRMPPETMLSLLSGTSATRSDGSGGKRLDLRSELQSRCSAEHLASFVTENVARDRGATNQLAEAFNSLATSDVQRRTAVSLAEKQVSQTDLGNDPEFSTIWTDTVSLLMSHSDAPSVPDDYQHLPPAADRLAVAVEDVSDDPPDRIAAWLATVTDSDLRALDQQLLIDLLRLEDRPEAWTSVLELATTRLNQLMPDGELELSRELLNAIAAVRADALSPFASEAGAAIDRMTAGTPLAHLLLLIRQAPDAKVPLLAAFCRLIGPALIVPLVSALAIEESRLAVRRMRDILIAFGEAAREPVKMLRASSNPAVRRTAVEVLRALGGESALSELQTLLTDPHTEVQREALRAIFEIGSEQAYALLEHALTAGGPRRRQAVIQTLSAMSDERAAPLFVHVLSHSSPSGAGAPVYLSAIEALGRCGAGRLGVATLKSLLYGGAWYAPLRTARIRAAAARALRNTGSLDAQSVLEAASTGGSRGVRRAAQIALMLPQRSFPRGNPP